MSENTHQLGTYYKRMPDGKVREYPNLPANADWQQIYGQSGLSIEPPEDFEPEDEQSEEEAEEALLGATAQGPDTEAPDPEAEAEE